MRIRLSAVNLNFSARSSCMFVWLPGSYCGYCKNQTMYVDEQRVTKWTRGRYPAAPPCKVSDQLGRIFYCVELKTTTCE